MINSTHPIKSLNTFTRTLVLLIPISYNITKELVGRVILMEINEKLRGINYNYFLITIPTYLNTVFSDKLLGVASCFTHDYEYDLERLRRTSPKEFNTLLETFDMDFLSIYKKVNDTKKVDDEIKLNIIKNNTSEELQKITIENYFIREEKISKYPFKKIA